MKVHIGPVPKLSIAMNRVADALEEFAPSWVTPVHDPKKADLQILHVIGKHAVQRWMKAPKFAAIQYCVGPLNPDFVTYSWSDIWDAAEIVWSYYALNPFIPEKKFYFSPLGIPKYFAENPGNGSFRNIDIFTSGYVSGPRSESIEEVAIAAKILGKKVMHLGPRKIQNMTIDPGPKWESVNNVSDSKVAHIYHRTKWVSGLRQVEGFEFPVIEGLISGARPIVFDRPDMRRWYDGHAVFIPPCNGKELVDVLVALLKTEPKPVTKKEQKEVAKKFCRERISKGFWSKLKEAQTDE